MRTRITTIVLLSLLALVAALAPSAHAGWVFTESNGDETLISQGKMKTSWENGSLIFDGEKNLLHFIDDRRQLIASGTIDELCEGMNQMMESMFEDIPPEQREMMKKMMQGETGESEVVDKGSGGKIAGFATTRYEVLQDGELREEIWTTDDASLRKEVQGVIKALMKFSSCFDQTGFAGESSYESSPEYLAIFDRGVPVKIVEHGVADEAPNTSQLSPREIPDATFALPTGYQTVPMSELWSGAAEAEGGDDSE